MRFNRDGFIEDCVAANREWDGQSAVREVLQRAVKDANAVLVGLGTPERAGLDVLLRSPTLTIFAAHWAPRMSLPAHEHRMWALIGLYTGREDNIFWRREPARVKAVAANVLFTGDVATLPADAVHSVTNPLPRFTCGIHIYGGDFFNTPRSQWNPETLAEEPSDGDTIRAMFERENERLRTEDERCR
jgi:predicted metal-dependent enzyme (double-stranded beta helix superfamily)